MRKKIGDIIYHNGDREVMKTLWAIPVQEGKMLLIARETNTSFVRRNQDMFYDVGFKLKHKPSYHFESSYSIWYRGSPEQCKEFLLTLDDEESQIKFKQRKNMTLDEINALGVLEHLGD